MIEELKSRWFYFASRAILPQPQQIWDSLHALYNEENRHYHNLTHIHDCLEKLDQWPTEIPNKNSIELALWFHDIIYDSQRADNEESSAALITHYLRGHPLETDAGALILATRHKETSGMHAEEIMCDIDISILGAIKKDKYLNYAQHIRKEYSWVPDDEYYEARARVLTNFLNRDRLFQTPYAIERWEEQARINLNNERDVLQRGKFM